MSAKTGDTVKVHYRGTLDDGSQFDSSAGREPLEFRLGTGQVIKGFDDAVTGMNPGDKKTVHIPADDAYGQHRADMMVQIQREQIPADINLELGMQLMMQGQNGQPIPVKVTDIQEDVVTLDANHELAGQDLTFELELVAIA
ncbi:MAG: peptidylprolyl isomerase [Trueperaceae bacterium]|nr:peptidylprolyl isomerase [Trueperaceae bacterium]